MAWLSSSIQHDCHDIHVDESDDKQWWSILSFTTNTLCTFFFIVLWLDKKFRLQKSIIYSPASMPRNTLYPIRATSFCFHSNVPNLYNNDPIIYKNSKKNSFVCERVYLHITLVKFLRWFIKRNAKTVVCNWYQRPHLQ